MPNVILRTLQRSSQLRSSGSLWLGLAPLLGLALLGAVQWPLAPREPREPQDSGSDEQERDRRHPLTAFREDERARLEELIEGAWLLTSFESDEDGFDQNQYSGFALFSDGFLSLTFYGSREVAGSLLGTEIRSSFQAHVFRYRISERLTLQAAGMMGFSNFYGDNELRFDGASNVSEYDLTLDEGVMRLRRRDGRRFHFRSVQGGGFPEHALEALRETRGGLPFDEE